MAAVAQEVFLSKLRPCSDIASFAEYPLEHYIRCKVDNVDYQAAVVVADGACALHATFGIPQRKLQPRSLDRRKLWAEEIRQKLHSHFNVDYATFSLDLVPCVGAFLHQVLDQIHLRQR